MHKQPLYILTLLLLLTACSTQKNTGLSRGWHAMKTVHNVHFNGKQAYKEGIDAIAKANTDDYSTVLNLYPVSNHTAAEASASSMDKSIEKCRKCIKLHGIHSRPAKIDPKRRGDPQYQNWLNSKEFNPQMYRAWMMLGQSEFHKGDFLGSVGTFNYVANLYANDADLVAQCRLWVARAYGEMGWTYEAEDIVSKVKVDDLKLRHQPFYAAVSADIALKQERYKEAIPYVKLAKENEKRKQYLPRFEFVLGQLYQGEGQFVPARAAYKRCYKLHPTDVDMAFNARLRYAELKADTGKTVRQLLHMAKLYKYKDALDRIYGVVGNIYLHNADTVQALAYYEKGIAESTKNSNDKALVLLTAGDLYYERHDYINASPCYKEAVQILNNEHPDYDRIRHRSEVLDEVVVEEQTIILQDSLQYLGSLSEEEQRAIVDKIIADLIEKEQQDSIKQAQANRQAQLDAQDGGLKSVNTQGLLGPKIGETANWYFYNPQLMKNGKQEFTRLWGTRTLEDNWRHLSKAGISSSISASPVVPSDSLATDSLTLATDSTGLAADSTLSAPQETDTHKPEYYLQQIPRTDQDYAASNAKIADALYRLIFIYRDRVPDQLMSDDAFADFQRRFPKDERMPEVYYRQYLNALRLRQDSVADTWREQILRLFPESPQAAIVSDANYFDALRRMVANQDSIYEATYNAYTHSDYNRVKANVQYVDTAYPLTPLMPRFLFLNAVSVAKTDGQQAFVEALQDMVERYPENELSAKAKDMLALMNQGEESQKGGDVNSLADKRAQLTQLPEDTVPADATFSNERNEPAMLLMVMAQDEQQLNNLLYQVALYNFSQFLIKDFDLMKIPFFTLENSALQVSGLDGLDEALWYMSLMQENSEMNILIKQLNITLVPITETNAKLLNKPFTLDDYQTFMTSNL